MFMCFLAASKKEITSVAFAGATWNTGALSGVAGEVLWCCHLTSRGVSQHDVKDFPGLKSYDYYT